MSATPESYFNNQNGSEQTSLNEEPCKRYLANTAYFTSLTKHEQPHTTNQTKSGV